MDNSGVRIYKGKGLRGCFSSSDWLLHYNVSVVFLGMLLIDTLQQRWHWSRVPLSWSTLFDNVHTWAISFLRHLAIMSGMVPFWASTDSVFVPNWGLRPKPRCPEEVVYTPNDSCSHFTQSLALRNFLSNIHVLLITIHSHHSYLLYITFIQATIAFIYMTYSHFHFPRLSWQAGCPRSFVSDTITHSAANSFGSQLFQR